MGVNLPADVVIIADLKKNTGEDRNVPLTSQEYKNYVGRAGRVGSGVRPSGRSYIIAENNAELEVLWNRYLVAGRTKVFSGLNLLVPEQQAPYLLNCIDARQSTQRDLERYLGSTFAFHASEPTTLRPKIREMLAFLKDLLTEDGNLVGATASGQALAGFALAVTTIEELKRATEELIKWSNINPAKIRVLPVLDVLFRVCLSAEIEGLTEPSLDDSDYQKDSAVRSYLRDEASALVAPGSRLDTLRKGDVPADRDLRAMKRSVLLRWWLTGLSTNDIRKRSKVQDFRNGDVARLADVASFVIEALASLASKKRRRTAACPPLERT